MASPYEWVLEGDITACFDEIDHAALLCRVRDRIGDRRVVRLIKAFLKAGVLTEDGVTRDTKMGARERNRCGPPLARPPYDKPGAEAVGMAVLRRAPTATRSSRNHPM